MLLSVLTLWEHKIPSPASPAQTSVSGKEKWNLYQVWNLPSFRESIHLYSFNPFDTESQYHSNTNEAVMEILDCVKWTLSSSG